MRRARAWPQRSPPTRTSRFAAECRSYLLGRRAESRQHLCADAVALLEDTEEQRLRRQAVPARVAESDRVAKDLLRARGERDALPARLLLRYGFHDLGLRGLIGHGERSERARRMGVRDFQDRE